MKISSITIPELDELLDIPPINWTYEDEEILEIAVKRLAVAYLVRHTVVLDVPIGR